MTLTGGAFKTFLIFILAFAAVDIAVVLVKLIPLMKRISVFNELKKDPDVISVEAEILEIHTKKLNDLDTQYDVKIYYVIGYQKFYKDIVLINKQAIRVGMILTMLCSSSDPEKAMIMDGSEAKSVKSYVVNLFIAIPILIIGVLLQILDAYIELGGL